MCVCVCVHTISKKPCKQKGPQDVGFVGQSKGYKKGGERMQEQEWEMIGRKGGQRIAHLAL